MFRRLLVLLAALAVPVSAFPASLGKVNVLSRLGEPLNAEIEIGSLKPGEEKTLSARLGTRAQHLKAGVSFHSFLGLRVSIGRRGNRPVVRLRTEKPVSEPSVQLVIDLSTSAGRVVRPYSVLLDPVGYAVSPAKASPAAPMAAKPPAPPKAAAKLPAESRASAETQKTDSAISRDELFGVPSAAAREPDAGTPSGRDALFGVPQAAAREEPRATAIEWRGFVQNYTAYDYEDPSHWSRGVLRTQLGAQGSASGVKWKATVRMDLDPVYAGSDFYPPEVRSDQRRDFFIRETYLDIPAGPVELRLGKQNIVWGEMVGLFFADVVSARDQRDFILPDFEIIRIPQWAARVEHFGRGYHAEAIWIPYTEVDIIGKPGAEFYPLQQPAPPGFAQQFSAVDKPPHNVRNSNFGLRVSTLRSGWDLSAFYYRSTDVNPTFYREVTLAPVPTLVFTPRHERIWQIGGTLGKDLGPTVLKAEMIYASGRKSNVTRLSEPSGVVPQDTLDYAVGLDFTLGASTRLNFQLFQRFFTNHDPDLVHDKHEDGYSVLLSTKIGAAWEPELLFISSLNRLDSLMRARLGWVPERNWRLVLGVDVFTGEAPNFFGRFDGNDRVYLETRYDF
jgi:hypothetical protein